VSLPPSQNQISKNVSCKLHNRHPTPCRDLNHADYHYIAALDSTLPDPPSTTSRIETLGVRLASLEKGVYRSPYVMCNLCNGDGIAFPRFVANWDLALELLVSQPSDMDICYWFLTRAKRREFLGVVERMTSASSGRFKRNTKLSVHTLEKDGQLQLRLSNKLCSVRSSGWSPHRLGYSSAHSH